MKRFLFTAVAAMAIGSSASAADLASRSYTKAPPPIVAAYNWTGFYIGAQGGYGWSQSVDIAGLTTDTDALKGGFAGGTIGYNWQGAGSPAVFGIEVDAAWSDINFNESAFGVTFEDRIRAFGSVTGRIGYAVDAALLYVKGGYAWADNRISASAFGFSLSENQFHSGWTIGGGLEYGFAPNWSGKIEYMYASYANENYLTAFIPVGVGIGADVHTIKAGINYRFGWGTPVVAKY
ncbi:outer membrane protein [Bradyrhizobium sp. Leo121]|uniref:outer membrane protein n=1 Tax=Bradyrhizobium sp. Leo121 TaxID=1571195 RepID=UPI001028CB32|nr:outer membrane protein [Bradyrhizobium sp. Leo121]RZN31246.1 porin family protein [Bradyrhizobium sp. Leo121]